MTFACRADTVACAMQKQFAAERTASMLEDRRIREAEIEAFQMAAAARTAKLVSRIGDLEKALQETTKEHILSKSSLAACQYDAVQSVQPSRRLLCQACRAGVRSW